MRRLSCWLLLLFLVVVGSPAVGQAQSRVALVIGEADYANTAPLSNPVNDAEDVSNALTGVGFKVTLLRNATKRQFDQALAQFARTAPGSEAALIYFAGHGMQFEGRNYLMPVDAELQDQISLRYEMVGVNDIKDALEASPGVKIMVLDSCRDNPLAAHVLRSAPTLSRDAPILHGLAPAEPTQGMVIVYATQAGQVAIDGVGRNSPFAKAFVEELAVPGLEVAALFRDVENKVVLSTGGRQSPELSISGVPEYYLTPLPTDEHAWEQIRDSRDPTAFKDFLARFPQSPLAAEAKFRLDATTAERRAETPHSSAPTPISAGASDDLEALFWQTALKYDRVSDYDAYLKRYPNGAFATLAYDRIAVLSPPPPTVPPVRPAPLPTMATRTLVPVDSAGSAEAAMWRSAEVSDTAADYRDYLSRYPKGIFATLASKRIASLWVKPPDDAKIAPASPAPPISRPPAKGASAKPETPPKPAPRLTAPARPAPAIVKPSLREPRPPVARPTVHAEEPTPVRAPEPRQTEDSSDNGCPPHYFLHVFPSASGYRCMPYP